ncbi:hypothetical protein Pen02_74500 [Plantactinospora endophytica]|uniref:Uncharacterized protein n=1 Tax=Plantactinospora endophytica TaxID=673535 RepID=A0ABQ4ECT1_9ACTN|nr:hypothetical protein Pen02_74500 [Plantactinospora endophytica]
MQTFRRADGGRTQKHDRTIPCGNVVEARSVAGIEWRIDRNEKEMIRQERRIGDQSPHLSPAAVPGSAPRKERHARHGWHARHERHDRHNQAEDLSAPGRKSRRPPGRESRCPPENADAQPEIQNPSGDPDAEREEPDAERQIPTPRQRCRHLDGDGDA